MKRFLVFAYDSYYPAGGAHDEVGSFDTLEEAMAAGNQRDDYDILDLDERKWVE
jgi:hypothetical protein